MATDRYRHRHRGDAAPRAGHERHDGDRGRAVAGAAELPAPLRVSPAGCGLRAAAVRRRFPHAFLYLERPEGMERVDAAEFVPAAPPPEPVGRAEVMPRVQGFLTVGHLYRGIEQGLSDLAGRLGERVVFVGEPRAQATPERFRWPQLIAVTSLASARAAIDEIIEQGEGRAETGARRIRAGSSRSGANTRSCVNRTRPLSPPGPSCP